MVLRLATGHSARVGSTWLNPFAKARPEAKPEAPTELI